MVVRTDIKLGHPGRVVNFSPSTKPLLSPIQNLYWVSPTSVLSSKEQNEVVWQNPGNEVVALDKKMPTYLISGSNRQAMSVATPTSTYEPPPKAINSS